MRTPQSAQKAQSTPYPLALDRAQVFGVPDRIENASEGTANDMPKALPDWVWHSLQWQR